MLDDRDIFRVLLRYKGLPVTVQTHSLGRVFGMLSSVHADCVRLTNTVPAADGDDGRWFNDMARAEWDERPTGRPETVIPFHQLVMVTCEDDDFHFNQLLEEENTGPVPTEERALQIKPSAPLELPPEVPEPFLPDGRRLEIEVGAQLTVLTSSDHDATSLVDRIRLLRRELMVELGFRIPGVRIHDNPGLPSDEYRIRIDGVVVGRGELNVDRVMAILPEDRAVRGLEGEATREPVFDLPAMWILPRHQNRAEAFGCTVVAPAAILMTHLSDCIRRRRSDLLSYETVFQMLQELREAAPSLVDENFPDLIPTQVLHRLLTDLLDEQVQINCFEKIVEALVWHYRSGGYEEVYERVRTQLSRLIFGQLVGSSQTSKVIVLPPELQERLLNPLPAEDLPLLFRALGRKLKSRPDPAVIATSRETRLAIRRSIAALSPEVYRVFSIDELSRAREFGVTLKFETLTEAAVQDGLRSIVQSPSPEF